MSLISSLNQIKKCRLANTITSVSSSAFTGFSNLSNVNVDNIVTIENSAFEGCEALNDVTFGSSLTYIGSNAFHYCSSFNSIVIPDNVTLDNNAFFYCAYATELTLGEGITTIPSECFYDCIRLEKITLPKALKNIKYQAFHGCTNIKNVYYGGTLLDWCNLSLDKGGDGWSYPSYEHTNLYINKTELVQDVVVPDSITSVRYAAFCGLSIKSVVIPNNITSIDDAAFWNCLDLQTLTFGSSVKSVGSGAFSNGNYSTRFNYNGTIGDWCAVTLVNEYSSPFDSVADGGGFYINGTLVTNLAIPEGVTSIGNYAFRNYTSATSLTLPSSLVTIGKEAFMRCSGITDVIIPESVTSIGDQAFSQAGSTDHKLTVTMKSATPPTLGTNVFSTQTLNKIYIPAGSMAAYSANTAWKALIDKGLVVEPTTVYPAFQGLTLNGATTLTEVPLEGSYFDDTATNEGAGYIVSIPSEVADDGWTNTGYQTFAIPASLTFCGMKVWDILQQKYVWLYGTAEMSKAAFPFKENVTKNINGVDVTYAVHPSAADREPHPIGERIFKVFFISPADTSDND